MSADFPSWMQKVRYQTELYLHQYLPPEQQTSSLLHQAMRYSALGGGKRLRPILVFASAQLGQYHEKALAQAVTAIELIHTYSLVHDDMPEMDNDTLRHGKATCHIQFNPATALLTGDALQTLAFEILAQENELPPAQQLLSIQTLAKASGSLGMAGGQAIDLANTGLNITLEELTNMHLLKTGALIEAAVSLGLLCCEDFSDNTLHVLKKYAHPLGLAFQVIDDILDYSSNTQTLGKTAGKDALNNKPTFVSLLGIHHARTYAQNLIEEAKSHLRSLESSAQNLVSLADFILSRKN